MLNVVGHVVMMRCCTRRALRLIAYLALVALTLKSCSASMDEPFREITFYGIVWQIIGPCIAFAVATMLTGINIVSFQRGEIRLWVFVTRLALLLFVGLGSLLNLYGYYWDLSHYTETSWR